MHLFAWFEYDSDVSSIPRQNSNTVTFSVVAEAGVIANGITGTPINGLSEPVSVNKC